MGLTKNLGWLSKYITAGSNGNISLGSDSGLGFQLLSATDNTRGLYMGYNYTGNYAQIEAVHQNVGYKNIVLNPSGGNVGIGNNNPIYAKLSISSGSSGALRIDTDAGAQGFSMNPNSIFGIDEPGISNGRFSVKTNGNVLIATTTDNGYRLNVNGSSSVSGASRASNFSPYNFASVTAGSPSSATIPLGYSSMSVASLCDDQWRPILNNINDVKAFCWVTMGDAASKDTASYQIALTSPAYGVNSMSNLTYSDNGWNTGSFGLSYDFNGGQIRLVIKSTSYYGSGNYAGGIIHFLRLE